MNLYSMEYFIAVAENLSFTKAADKVHISQTTMSFQIAAMEKELGFQLFKRNKRSVQLTPAGNSFYYSARHIVDSYKEAVQKAQKLASGAEGYLNVVCVSSFLGIAIADQLRGFQKAYPEIFLNIEIKEPKAVIDALLQNKADVALALPYDMMREEKIEVRTFNQNPLYLCVHQEHPFARLEEFTSDMLPEVDLIACDPKIVPEVYRFHYDCEKIYGVKPRTFLKTKTVEEIILLIRLNRGVSLLPKYMFGQHICYDEIVGIPFTHNGKMQYMRSAMGYEKTNSNPAVKRFTEYLLHYLE